jgi:magnesium chelatase family protein
LDELTLYRRDVLETLRAPLEDGVVRIARAGGTITYPCRFTLIGAMNPCPCGFLGDSAKACTCTERDLATYRARLSGPLLDRFDIHLTVARLRRHELMHGPDGDSSEVVRTRVVAARARQRERFDTALVTNSSAPRSLLDGSLELSAAAEDTLGRALDALGLSGRGFDRVLRVARTLADLEGRSGISGDDVAEALTYRGGSVLEVAA